LKSLVTISIEAPSSNDLKQSEKTLTKVIDEARLHINNGAKIKRSITDADDPRAMMALMGQLKWWSLGKPEHVDRSEKREEKKKRGWLGELGRMAKSIYEDEIEI